MVEFTADIVREGEVSASRLRLIIVTAAATIPIGNLIANPQDPEPWIGGAAALLSVLIGVWFLSKAKSVSPPPWLSTASALLDVTLVSAANAAFIFSGQAMAATNGRVVFPTYLLALTLGVLRQNQRLCLLTGITAVAQYAGIVLWAISTGGVLDVLHPTYGSFRWDNQISRLAILGLCTAINVAIVRQSRLHFTASIYDSLTGLTNRRYATQRLTEIVDLAARNRHSVTLALIDLDRFKQVNDRYGHAAGDAVLRGIAGQLRASFRSSDLVSRYGGEEFVVVLPDGDAAGAIEHLERFRIEFAQSSVTAGETPVRLTLSMGVSVYPQDGRTTDTLLAVADRRLYQAKRGGRDRIVAVKGEPQPAPRSNHSLKRMRMSLISTSSLAAGSMKR